MEALRFVDGLETLKLKHIWCDGGEAWESLMIFFLSFFQGAKIYAFGRLLFSVMAALRR